MPVTKAQTRANYDRLSRWYDLLAGSSERAYRELGLRKLNVQPGERVLEIGTGTGQAMPALAQAVGPAGAICGLDMSPGMCQVAGGRTGQTGSPAFRTLIVCGDAGDLPFPAGTFDAIFTSFTLELCAPPEMMRVLEESRRVLKDHGRLGVVSLADTGIPNLMTRVYTWMHHQFPAWIDCRPIPLKDILLQSGFHPDDVTRSSMWGLPVEIAIASQASYS
jgi:ubiquinone/menaquinone biosynthesis C-methylase UbiE